MRTPLIQTYLIAPQLLLGISTIMGQNLNTKILFLVDVIYGDYGKFFAAKFLRGECKRIARLVALKP
jgi:hypothetical protein